MGKSNPNKPGLTRNFRPQVRLKKDSACCSLKRHYRGALREFVGYCDLLALQDADRFVWATFSDIGKHCTNYRTKKRYSPRIVKYCKNTLRQQNIISGQVERIRNGVKRRGFIMPTHESITSKVENQCIFKAQIAPPLAPQIAPVVAPTIAPVVAPQIAPRNENNCTDSCTDDCTSETEQAVGESRGCTDSQKVLPEVLPEFGRSYPSNRDALEPSSLGSRGNPQQKVAAVPSSNPGPKPTGSEKISNDMTTDTVGERFGGEHSLEEMVNWISDGIFTLPVLSKYEHGEELRSSCQEAVRQMSETPLVDRTTCADVMDRAMGILKERYELNAPKGWMPVFKQLRDEGGPIVASESQRIPAREILTDPRSALHWYEEQCRPFEDRLIAVAAKHGVPSSWVGAVAVLGEIPELVNLRNEIAARIPQAVPQSA